MFSFKHLTRFSIVLIFVFLIYFSFSSESENEFIYHIPCFIINNSRYPVNVLPEHIAIVVVLADGLDRSYYRISLDSIACYAKAHGYQFMLTKDKNWECDYIKDKFLRLHCIVSKILPKYEAVIHLDADIGVVNPKKKLEIYLDEKIDITFYDRHFSPEIAMGSYIVRNRNYSINLLKEFSEYKVPDSNQIMEQYIFSLLKNSFLIIPLKLSYVEKTEIVIR